MNQTPVRELDLSKVFEFLESQGEMISGTLVKQGILTGLDKK